MPSTFNPYADHNPFANPGASATNLRTWERDGFRLRITGARRDGRNRVVLSYVLHDYDWEGGEGRHLFVGDDYRPSPMHPMAGDASIAELLAFLATGAGDVEADYFLRYTDTQVNWRDSHRREWLATIAMEMEERAGLTERRPDDDYGAPFIITGTASPFAPSDEDHPF